jgi:hypothetical protein
VNESDENKIKKLDKGGDFWKSFVLVRNPPPPGTKLGTKDFPNKFFYIKVIINQ